MITVLAILRILVSKLWGFQASQYFSWQMQCFHLLCHAGEAVSCFTFKITVVNL